MRVLVLQHIACEPPGVYEGRATRAGRGARARRARRGRDDPARGVRRDRRFGADVGQVSTEMARAWAEVPEYAASLESVLGHGATGDFVARIEERSAVMLAHGRGLFERWLDAVVLPRVTAGAVTA